MNGGRGGGPAWYLWSVLAVTSVAGPAVAVKVSGDRTDAAVRASQRASAEATAKQKAAEEDAKAEARIESRRLTCSFFAVHLDVYDETPPVSPAGRNLRKVYLDLYSRNECVPPRK